MKILLINISLRPGAKRLLVPIGLAYVASALKRAGWDFDLLDLDACPYSPRQVAAFLKRGSYDLVAMGCIVTGYKYVKTLAAQARQANPRTTVVVGNTVASSIPEILLTHTEADIAVLGEGDQTLAEVIACLARGGELDSVAGIVYRRKGELIRTPPRPPIADLDSIPRPQWDIFDLELYIRSLSRSLNEPLPPLPPGQVRAFPINTARGCPFHCSFCYQAFHGLPYRRRSARSVVAEMRYLHRRYGINHFCFHDDLSLSRRQDAEELAREILASGLAVTWEANCRAGLFQNQEDLELVRLLKRAGALSLGFALESADADILKWMNKKITVEMFLRQASIVKGGGLAVTTSLVVGYPPETRESIKKTIDVCIQAGVYPSLGFLLPQPGTPMYDYARRQGLIPDQEAYLLEMGDRQDLRLNLTRMSDQELQAVVQEELARCARELGIDLAPARLVKTGVRRMARREPGA